MKKFAYIKQCPCCNKNIEYSTRKSLLRSIEKNSDCRTCFLLNKKLNAEYDKVHKRLERNCPICSNLMTYINIESFRLSSNTNTKCNSCAKTGENNPSFGKTFKHKPETIEKITKSNIGKKRSPEMIKINTLSRKKTYKKENHPRWKGGITNINASLRKTIEYKQWRSNVFIRDNYCCKVCNDTGELNVHHIISFTEVMNTEMQYNINNGITLCKMCHIRFHKDYGINNFPSILEIYNLSIVIDDSTSITKSSR